MVTVSPKMVLDAQEKASSEARISAKLQRDIKLLQQRSGWSIRTMADFYGVPSSTLGSWRAGHCPKQLQTYLLIIFSAEHLE
jgi:DNA-binding transcriptional regulator YiaG